MGTFEITIQRKLGDGWPVVAERSEPGVFLPVRVEGSLQLDTVELLGQTTPERYGTVLGRALFRDGVRDAFAQARAESDDELHVLLVVEDRELLSKLRWERLCAPLDGEWRLLALDQRVPFSLYLPSLADRRFPPIGRRDLRALIMAASPRGLESYDLAPFEVAAAVADVRAALGEIPSAALAPVDDALGPPTLDALCNQLTAERYTLLHVVCHGGLAADGETVLYLADAAGQVEPVPAARLVDRLANLRSARGLPHLAFLSSCETASAKAEGALGGLGQRLVRDLGMPAVVAMTDPVSVETARALSAAFYRRLREHGEVDSALVEASAGLAERHDATVPALFSRLGGQPLFSDALDRELVDRDLDFGLGRLEALAEERAPVLRERVATCAQTLRGTLGTPAATLSATARTEREAALAEANTLGQEIADLSFNALALGQEPPPYDGRCPFRGLYPFRPDDRPFFFGREELVKKLLQRLAGHNFLAVLGASGSGKSSLVLAGLVPALQTQEPGLELAYLKPGDDPLANLEASLASVGDRPAVVVVDQLEELFTLYGDPDGRRAFATRLLEVAAERSVVLTMRADFWDECAGYGAYTEAMQAHQELIAPLDATELRAAIELQARAVRLRFEAGLSDTILGDVQGEPGAMPLLQHALLELWNRRHGRWLRADEYRAIGGVQRAIAGTAESVYGTLAAADQARVRAIFLRLTRLDDEALRPEGRRDTRRRVRLDELQAEASDAETTKALVARLADARLLVTGQDQPAGRGEVEVGHEALIRHWPRLQAWLEEDRAFLLWRQRLGADRADWEQTQRDEGSLLRGVALATAERWLAERPADLNPDERGYIAASLALREGERQAARRRTRLAFGGLVAALLAISTFAVFAGVQWNAARLAESRAIDQRDAAEAARAAEENAKNSAAAAAGEADRQRQVAEAAQGQADEQARIAREQRRIALARQLAAEADLAQRQGAGLLERSALLAVESVLRFPTLAGDQAVRRGLDLLPRPVAALADRDATPLAFSPDGRYVLTTTDDPGVFQSRPRSANAEPGTRVWEVQSGRLVSRLPAGRDLRAAAFSPDGATVITAGGDGTRVWKVAGGEIRSLSQEAATRLVFNPDGRYAAAAAGQLAMVWETASWGVVARLEHRGAVKALAFNPDGDHLATGSGTGYEVGPAGDNRARVWHIAQGREVARLEHGADVNAVAFSGDGRLLATASSDATGRSWEWAPGSRGELANIRHPLEVNWVAFSKDGRYVATATEVVLGQLGARLNSTVLVWRADGSGQVTRLALDDQATGLAFTPEAEYLVTASWDGLARVWEVEGGREVARVVHGEVITALGLGADGKHLLTGSRDGSVRAWEPTAGHQRLWTARDLYVAAVAFSRDGRYLATANHDKTGRTWEIATGREVGRIDHREEVIAIAFSPDGTRLATASRDNSARVREVAGGSETVLPHDDNVNAIEFSPDGGRIVTGGRDTWVRSWDASNARELRRLAHDGNVTAVAFNRDGQLLATASGEGLGGRKGDNTARVWDPTTGQELKRIEHAKAAWAVTFSPDGKLLATAGEDGVVRFWEVPGYGEVGHQLRHENGVKRVAFSPDGRHLATASGSAASVWELASGQEVARISYDSPGGPGRRRIGEVNAVAFGVDGRSLATGGWDGVRTWTLWTEDLVRDACARLTRNLSEREWRQYLPDEPYRKTCPNLP